MDLGMHMRLYGGGGSDEFVPPVFQPYTDPDDGDAPYTDPDAADAEYTDPDS